MTARNLAVNNSPAAEIRSRPCPNCPLCGAAGSPLYDGLRDRLFGAPGEWNLKRCPDAQCGLIWLDPMPLEEDIAKAYAKYYTHEVPSDVSASQPSFRRRIAKLMRSSYVAHRFNCGDGTGKRFRWLLALPILLSRIECDWLDIPLSYLAVPHKGRMLDVGCGDGSVLKLAGDLGWKAEGVDFDPVAVEAVRRKGLSVRAGRLSDQHYPEDSFDLVRMSHVIEHIHDPLGTLGEIRRLLRADGTLVVTTPNADSWGHRHFGPDWRGLEPPRHLQIFSGNNLVALARLAGFAQLTVLSTLRITRYVFVQSRLIRLSGQGGTTRAATLLNQLQGGAAAAAELLMRTWDPFAAEELLLEARK